LQSLIFKHHWRHQNLSKAFHLFDFAIKLPYGDAAKDTTLHTHLCRQFFAEFFLISTNKGAVANGAYLFTPHPLYNLFLHHGFLSHTVSLSSAQS